ncbi:precorrin-6Y methyltransferase [Acidovorax sp. Leaf76]|uniref:bifunctional cobalt-precorrin-7 (C(5))-methyltransferase/cobalt-precorrin-6B (C(15))-methyltransferase n=1 Tax=unclassified Acidovorax TaxID=2684926 RepID=UPI0006FD8FEB|nr:MULTISPECIES: bifunctional cobalt-precorrin-7 (C(5))-methyltransferase/cobalt-precorrin-6B (C(15))-methyltransferase [unclassified Acidovorax]KQO22235.1 precorrin-6Y methyltransferase [Acidovorax sp. Leaf76]KQO35303.1 precorrin-6Y methyltransferase [Acidovorax sp. Leaf84]KQS35085.1 precorrin-6Y methyltransferase [Acidovorax sp. Leaf191]
MTDPWLTLVGLNEDGLEGLAPAARRALDDAQVVFGGPRHLALAEVGDRGRPWPVPFDVAPVLALRGQRVVVLASGDPFWFGAGGSLAAHLAPHEWRCHAQPSTFSLVAARLGWRLEAVDCLGLHASPLQQLLPRLAPGRQFIVLLRDGAAAAQLAQWLVHEGWGDSSLWVMEAVGGPRERCRRLAAHEAITALPADPALAPVAVALQAQGGVGMPQVPGRADDFYAHDGQITKAPARALTLAALAPRRGERLWDIGSGSGSIAVEWCLAGGTAHCVEQHAARADNIRRNAEHVGLQAALQVVHGTAPAALHGLQPPEAVFVGGGFDAALFTELQALMPAGCRLVVNAVTLETQALLVQLHGAHGGQLLRLELSSAQPLGRMHSWQAARPLVQWSWQR